MWHGLWVADCMQGLRAFLGATWGPLNTHARTRTHTHTDTNTDRERERERETETNKQTNKQTNKHTHRERGVECWFLRVGGYSDSSGIWTVHFCSLQPSSEKSANPKYRGHQAFKKVFRHIKQQVTLSRKKVGAQRKSYGPKPYTNPKPSPKAKLLALVGCSPLVTIIR